MSLRDARPDDFEAMLAIINKAARRYHGAVPPDCLHTPYMSKDEMQREIQAGVDFRVFETNGQILGIMGRQAVKDVLLVRHAYVIPEQQGQGVGSALMQDVLAHAESEILVGTWSAAVWAIAFYQRHGFVLQQRQDIDRLLKTYWTISERQIETSVVLRHARPGQ